MKLLVKNNRICKYEKNLRKEKDPTPSPFYVVVVNVRSLCYGKCITQMKDGPSIIKFLKSVSSLLYYSILETTDFFSSDFILNFLFFFSFLFLIPSITGFLCCYSFFFCGHTHLQSVLGNSDFFQSLLIDTI